MSAWEKRVESQAKKKNNQRVTYNISLDDLEVKKSMPPGVCQPQCTQKISKRAFISTPWCWRSLLFFLKDQTLPPEGLEIIRCCLLGADPPFLKPKLQKESKKWVQTSNQSITGPPNRWFFQITFFGIKNCQKIGC